MPTGDFPLDPPEVRLGNYQPVLQPPVDHRPATFRIDDGNFPLDSVMAIEPTAFDCTYAAAFRSDAEARRKPYLTTNEGVAVVDVMGPLARRAMSFWFWFVDGYDFIEQRFTQALKDPDVEAVVLRLDSPGGAASGVFEAVSSMRKAKKSSGKRVYAYADDMAASAAYALATVADEIWLPEGGLVGSIGVIGVLAEQSTLLKKVGINVRVMTTGAQKADGHPAVPLTEDVVKRYQARIDHLGDLFFQQVAEARNMTAKDIQSLEAGVFQGSKAIAAGLADGVSSFDELMSSIVRNKSVAAGGHGKERSEMPEKETAAASGNAGGGVTSPPMISLITMALAMGLTATASESEVINEASKKRNTCDSLASLTGKQDMQEALGVVQAGLIAAKALPEIQKQLAEVQSAEAKRELDACIEAAKAAGKITSPETEKQFRALGESQPKQLKALLESLPVLVNTQSTATKPPPSADDAVLSASDLAVAKQLGLTAKQFIEARDNARKEAAAAAQGLPGQEGG